MKILALSVSLLILVFIASGCIGQEPGANPKVITGNSTIFESGVYVLNEDISCVAAGEADACITIRAGDAILDCKGHGITLENSDGRGPANTGIHMIGAKHVIVKNCRIENFEFGIYLTGIYNSFINNTISRNSIGIYYDDYSSFNNFTNNTVSDNSNKGIYLFMRSSNNTFADNIIRNNGIYGIVINCAAHYNTFSNNVIDGNGYGGFGEESGGIYIFNSYASILSGNRICNNSRTLKCKFDLDIEGVSESCKLQALAHTVPIDRAAQEAGILFDGGGNICGPSSMSCDATAISCSAC